ncbi:J domain-containing protein [Prochlorococcus marinus]|uniref:J domain-containing protein n=1 Tax=Prochlorococcus marinus TaxID=1219 RepID=UPI0022B30C86|nr:J domain-containing protein [Prochlorococcus marinus]
MKDDPYTILGVTPTTPFPQIKSVYRALVKKYHPDTGGDQKTIIKINAAWKLLKEKNIQKEKATLNIEKVKVKAHYKESSQQDIEISIWLKDVYKPIDKLMNEIINAFPKQLKKLSADPYDDVLMANFCQYISNSQGKIKRIKEIYQSISTPLAARTFSLTLYQCFSEIEDGLIELERYTSGYVETYLHDGHEMLRKAKKQLLALNQDCLN